VKEFGFARFRINEFAVYERPVPAVVVAPEYTSPFVPIPNPPEEREVKKRFEEMVDDAVEKNPFVKASVVDVELYPVLAVKGKLLPLTQTPEIEKQPFFRLIPPIDEKELVAGSKFTTELMAKSDPGVVEDIPT
jgi:hypothetical protein